MKTLLSYSQALDKADAAIQAAIYVVIGISIPVIVIGVIVSMTI